MVFTLLSASIIYLNLHIIATILSQEWKPRLKDIIYAILAALLFSASTVFLFHHISHLLVDITGMLLIFFYLYKLKSYSVKKSVILLLIAILFAGVIEFLVVFVMHQLVPVIEVSNFQQIQILAALLMVALSLVLTPLFTRITGRFRKAINQSAVLQTVLLCALILVVLSIQLNLLIVEREYRFVADQLLLLIILSVIYGAVVLISFLLYAKSLKTKYELKQKESEQQALQYYINEIEQQYTATRKFQHDYQNILLSFDRFIEESDLDGLKEYYNSSVKKTSANVTQNRFVLERLGKIKTNELKSILAAKLLTAQQMGIDTTVEVNAEIDFIPTDSLMLIRMIGIIMDNAIEELVTLESGRLLVGCFKNGNDLTFIVQNTCRSDIPSLRQLKTPGFSTKGTNRGLGLTNLSELADLHPNIILETSIMENNFIQKLTIGGAS